MTKQLRLGCENYQHIIKIANDFKLQANAPILFFCFCPSFVMVTKLSVIVTFVG